MNLSRAEQHFVSRFIIKNKQERYLHLLNDNRTRIKFIEKLYHFNDFNWNLLREIPGSENEEEAIRLKLKSYKTISNCRVISSDPKFDGKSMSIEEAINNVVGIEASILIFGDGDVIYYEGEAPNRRFISI
ncbi:hypothetical protein [Flavihumibacter solisilvae]|uniref:Uncharacterized protein n=1 Tax=Flavihumibacter solisilvae TaxID=1349421 RepID=A0A0C1IHY6_9BACT|nr:hypothetical protein [Flavihumibacter solisilvae]KIC90089.1 hypothetical protein OI18_23400 [Flavihumibacter solisilvae]